MLELQKTMMSQFNRLLAGKLEEMKRPVVHLRVDNEDLAYSLGGTPINVQVQLDERPQGAFFTISSRQYQTGTLTLVNRLMGPESNLRINLANPVTFDNPAEIKQAKVERPDTMKASRKKGNKGNNEGRYNKGHSKPITVGRSQTETTNH